MSASFACSSHSPFTCTAGAPPQAARHSTGFTVNLPSLVVPWGSMPSFLQVRSEEAVGAPQGAGEGGADLDQGLPLGLQAEHRVEARGVVHLGDREARAGSPRTPRASRLSQPSCSCSETQGGKKRRPLHRVAGHDLLELGLPLGGELHGYQSSAPDLPGVGEAPAEQGHEEEPSRESRRRPRLL